MTPHEARQRTAAQLAFVGDAAWELAVRTHLLDGPSSVGAMHRKAVDFVCAGAQARLLDEVISTLTEEEADLARRGRNAHAGPVPRGASTEEYGKATALEVLVGYWHLSGQHERIQELLEAALRVRGKGGRT